MGKRSYLASQICWLLGSSKEFFRLLALNVAHLCEIEVAHSRATPYYPVSVVLAQSQYTTMDKLEPIGPCGFRSSCPTRSNNSYMQALKYACLGIRLHAINNGSGTHLFARHRVSHQREIDQLLKSCQWVQVGQLGYAVFGEYQCLQARYARREIGLDVRYAVLGEEQCAESGLQRKVAELRNVVVSEVDRIVVLRAINLLLPTRLTVD
jgi:hypothetical protein